MSENPVVYYSVRAYLPAVEAVEPYVRWLETEHIPDVLKTGHADEAEIHLHESQEGSPLVEGRYRFRSREDLEQYVQHHAPRLRSEGIRLFPKNRYERSISSVRARVSLTGDDKRPTYELLERQIDAAITKDLPWDSRLVSLIALLKQSVPDISWVGLYRAQGETLWVGPYQGPLACAKIDFAQGVCGLCARTKETVIVPDVLEFPGHIACDSLSRSEIVLPIHRDGEFYGVLDVDSHRVGAFDAIDAEYLEKFIKKL